MVFQAWSRHTAVALLALAINIPAAHADLIHRYSFDDGTAKDLVGKVDGKLHGDAKITDGKLILDNTGKAADDAKFSYLDFASSVLPKNGSATLVVWFTCKDADGFSRVLDFGEKVDGAGQHFIYLTPHTADSMSRAAITGSDVGSRVFVDNEQLDDGKPHMVAIVIDGKAKKLHMFVDGKEPKPAEDLADNTLDKVHPANCNLGKSNFDQDPGFTGSIDEFRVYDEALSPEDVTAAFKAGTDTVPATKTPAEAATQPVTPGK